MSLTTPAARRDQSYHLHPATNLRAVQNEGPLVITRGEGSTSTMTRASAISKAWPGCGARRWGFPSGGSPTPRTARCASCRSITLCGEGPGDQHRARRAIDRARAGGNGQSALRELRLRGERHGDQARLVLQQCHRPAEEEEDHLAQARVPRRDGRDREPDGTSLRARDFDLPIERILHTDCPHYYRGAEPGESEEAFAARLADNLEQLILHEGPDTVAAFFAEPVMGAGGVIVPPATYFDRIQPILKKHDILFVADEVICGFGRTGNMFGSQTFDLQPDIMTLAKAFPRDTSRSRPRS